MVDFNAYVVWKPSRSTKFEIHLITLAQESSAASILMEMVCKVSNTDEHTK